MDNTLFNRGRYDIAYQTRHLPIDQQREIWQNWIDTLDDHFRRAATLTMNSTLFVRQGNNIASQTRGLPIDQQREIWQDWINTSDGYFRQLATRRMIIALSIRQGDNIEHRTLDLPIDDHLRPQATRGMNSTLESRQSQNQLPEVDQQREPIPQPDQIPHEQLNEPLLHIDEGLIQQDLLRLIDEFRELQGLPQLDERFHPVVYATATSSRISRDRLTEHQETVSRLVQRERELNLTPEERGQASLNLSRALMQDLHLDVDFAWNLGIRLIEITPTLEEYNRIQDASFNREVVRQRTNAGRLLGVDLSQVPTEQYMAACSTVMLAMDERIYNVYGRQNDGEDPWLMGHVRLMMEDVFMRGGMSEA